MTKKKDAAKDGKKPTEELTDKDLSDVAGGLSLSTSVSSKIGRDFETAFGGGDFETAFGGGDFETAFGGSSLTADASVRIKGADQLKR